MATFPAKWDVNVNSGHKINDERLTISEVKTKSEIVEF
jgi:hypothetical protein